MTNVGMESQIQMVIATVIKIQGNKRYNDKNPNFQNMVQIIKGLLEEVRALTIPLLNDILINLNKKKLNLDQYKLSYQILSEMKNILSAPINQLIFQLASSDLNKDIKQQEILRINGEELCHLLNILCKISHEYLINFLSTLPTSESIKKSKMRGATILDIFLSIFSNQNSLMIAKDYLHLFTNFIESFSSKLLKENDKIKIFLCLLKFLYRSNKTEMKKLKIHSKILEKIKAYFIETKSESMSILILDAVRDKFFKNKKITLKLISYAQIFLESKNIKLAKYAFEFNFSILIKKIIKVTSLFDLFSIDKKKRISKLSFVFNNLINKYDSHFKNDFNEKMKDLLNDSSLQKSQTIIILFYLTLNDYKANSMLHKYFLECLDICYVVLNIFSLNDVAIKFVSPIKNNISIAAGIQERNDASKSTKLQKIIEQSKIKLENESNFINEIEDLVKDENLRNELIKLFQIDLTDRSQQIEFVFEKNKKMCEMSFENLILFKKAFMVLFEYKEIKSITLFGSLLLNSLDEMDEKEENKKSSISNSNSFEFLQTLLSVLFYYVKFNISLILIQDRQNFDIKNSPKVKYFLNQVYIDTFNEILDFIRKILITKILNKDVISYITIIIKNLLDLKNEILIESIKNLILNEFSHFCFDNYEISIKSLAMMYYELNKITNQDGSFFIKFNYLLPNNFEKYLFEFNKKISPIKFINEMIKIDKNQSDFNEIVFSERYKKYILYDLQELFESNYEDSVKQLKNASNKSDIKRNLLQLIILKHEMLKYEFYSIMNENNIKLNHLFLKKIFNKIYEICKNSEEFSNKENQKHKEKDKEKQDPQYDDENLKYVRIIKYTQILDICKFINLIFRHFDNRISLKPTYQLKFMNLALHPDLTVRDYLLKKIEKCLSSNRSLINYLHAIPIASIYFNDPDKSLKKKSNFLFSNFINHLISRYKVYKNSNKNKNSLYKYLPEVYITYIISYFVFNPNLNLLYNSKEIKFFESIIANYLKILKKVSNGKYDSNFLIQNCIKIKNQSLKEKKIIKKLSNFTYLRDMIKVDNILIKSENYEIVKNEVCNKIIKIINTEYSTSFIYEDIKPNIPIIFSNEKENSMALSYIKSSTNKIEDFTNTSKNVNNVSHFNNSINNEMFKKENEISKILTDNNNISNIQINQKSNVAVKNYKLQLEPNSSSKLQIDISKDFDEFVDLPYYSKYINVDSNLNLDEENVDVPLITQSKFSDLNNSQSDDSDSKFATKRKNNDNIENKLKYKKKKN